VLDEIKKFFLSRGVEMDYLGPTEFAKFIEEDIAFSFIRISSFNLEILLILFKLVVLLLFLPIPIKR